MRAIQTKLSLLTICRQNLTVQKLQFQKQFTPIVSNMSLFGNNQKFAFNREKVRSHA